MSDLLPLLTSESICAFIMLLLWKGPWKNHRCCYCCCCLRENCKCSCLAPQKIVFFFYFLPILAHLLFYLLLINFFAELFHCFFPQKKKGKEKKKPCCVTTVPCCLSLSATKVDPILRPFVTPLSRRGFRQSVANILSTFRLKSGRKERTRCKRSLMDKSKGRVANGRKKEKDFFAKFLPRAKLGKKRGNVLFPCPLCQDEDGQEQHFSSFFIP